MKPLVLRKARLRHFRNYDDSVFRFGDEFNLITGLNGIGKTNLLDAVYYLCVGKSYFSNQDQRVVQQGSDFFRLEGEVLRDDQTASIVIKVRPGQTKEILRNEAAYGRVSEHLGYMPVVFSAPRDIEIVAGTGQVRRRYVDHLLCQIDPVYLNSLMAYNHLLVLRTAALKKPFSGLMDMLDTYDDQMEPHASVIFDRRQKLTVSLIDRLRETYAFLSDDSEPIAIRYESQLHEYPYRVLAARSREHDRQSQRSNTGVQKDDFYLTIRDMSAREFGSQGQIKSLIFSLHLSKYALLREQSGFLPLLILDDIFDKLDERRLRRLMEMLTQPDFGQVFISDTSSERVTSMLRDFPVHHISMG